MQKKNYYKFKIDKKLHGMPTPSQKGVLLQRMSTEVFYEKSDSVPLLWRILFGLEVSH